MPDIAVNFVFSKGLIIRLVCLLFDELSIPKKVLSMEYCYIYILVQLCILVKSIKINESLVPLYFASQACASKKM